MAIKKRLSCLGSIQWQDRRMVSKGSRGEGILYVFELNLMVVKSAKLMEQWQSVEIIIAQV